MRYLPHTEPGCPGGTRRQGSTDDIPSLSEVRRLDGYLVLEPRTRLLPNDPGPPSTTFTRPGILLTRDPSIAPTQVADDTGSPGKRLTQVPPLRRRHGRLRSEQTDREGRLQRSSTTVYAPRPNQILGPSPRSILATGHGSSHSACRDSLPPRAHPVTGPRETTPDTRERTVPTGPTRHKRFGLKT